VMPIAAASLSAARSATRIQRIQDLSGFAAVRPHWDGLLSASAVNNPFLTFEWLHAWWTNLRGNATLQAIAVWSDDELIAVAPLMAKRTPGWFSRLEFLGTGHAGSDYLDLIVRRGRDSEALHAIGEFIANERQTLMLEHVPESSLAASVARRLEDCGWTTSIVPNGICPIIDLAGHTWESYLATRGRAHRANVRRRLRGLTEPLDPAFERVTTDSQREEALSALFGYHEWRFRTQGGSTAFLTPALRAFHQDATRQALERGWLRMYVLRLNGAPAAVMYGFAYNRRFYFYQHGFDDQYKQHSVGLALMGLTIRSAIEEGHEEFDMLWGVESYKGLWAHDARQLRQIHLFPAHLGGAMHRHAIQARKHLGRLARRVLTTGETSAT
jgi:CelD/BcsL family acetyltransferase involved in cellulose biosynthesis